MAKKEKKLKDAIKHSKKSTIIWYIGLRLIVIVTMIVHFIEQDYSSVFLCLLTLILFLIPYWVEDKIKIKIPDLMEILIYVFIFSAEILGEINNFYITIPYWDTILHTINGFLSAAIGFSLIDILNNTEKVNIKLTPIFVSLVAFCFSMTIGVLWEFVEFGADQILKIDMQKDDIVQTISSVTLDESKNNNPIVIDNIEKTIIYSNEDNKEVATIIEGGYLDVGLRDTMEDLIVNFIGAITFSIVGYFYIQNRDKYKFAENFIPKKA